MGIVTAGKVVGKPGHRRGGRAGQSQEVGGRPAAQHAERAAVDRTGGALDQLRNARAHPRAVRRHAHVLVHELVVERLEVKGEEAAHGRRRDGRERERAAAPEVDGQARVPKRQRRREERRAHVWPWGEGVGVGCEVGEEGWVCVFNSRETECRCVCVCVCVSVRVERERKHGIIACVGVQCSGPQVRHGEESRARKKALR